MAAFSPDLKAYTALVLPVVLSSLWGTIMDIEKKSLINMLNTEHVHYSVPLFQRYYAWHEEQCRKLWRYLLELGNESDPVFAGTLIYMTKTSANATVGGAVKAKPGIAVSATSSAVAAPALTLAHEKEREIVNGQQLFISIHLVLIALYESLEQLFEQVIVEQNHATSTSAAPITSTTAAPITSDTTTTITSATAVPDPTSNPSSVTVAPHPALSALAHLLSEMQGQVRACLLMPQRQVSAGLGRSGATPNEAMLSHEVSRLQLSFQDNPFYQHVVMALTSNPLPRPESCTTSQVVQNLQFFREALEHYLKFLPPLPLPNADTASSTTSASLALDQVLSALQASPQAILQNTPTYQYGSATPAFLSRLGLGNNLSNGAIATAESDSNAPGKTPAVSASENKLITQGCALAQLWHTLQQLTIAAIELDYHQDRPQEVFAALHSMGVPLRSSDLIRNYVLMLAPEAQRPLLYERYWRSIENMLELVANEHTHIDNFIALYLDIFFARYRFYRDRTPILKNKNNDYERFQLMVEVVANLTGKNVSQCIPTIMQDLLYWAPLYIWVRCSGRRNFNNFLQAYPNKALSYYLHPNSRCVRLLQAVEEIRTHSEATVLVLTQRYVSGDISYEIFEQCLKLVESCLRWRNFMAVPPYILDKFFSSQVLIAALYHEQENTPAFQQNFIEQFSEKFRTNGSDITSLRIIRPDNTR